MRPFVGAVAVLVALVAAALAVAQGRCGDVACRADVDISGHAEPQPIRLGDTSELKLTAKNDGYDGALAIDLQATVPDGLKILSVTHFGGRSCTQQGTFVRCDLGDFAREQEAVVRIKVQGVKVGTWLTPAKVYASDVQDPNGGNNQVTATLMVKDRVGEEAGPQLTVADPQRILRAGGVRIKLKSDRNGTLKVRGEVRTTIGRVPLVSVTRAGVKEGSTQDVFLGTTEASLKKVRSGFKTRSRQRVIVWATIGGKTVRRELHVRR